jgi:hypothetical protein
MAGEIMSSDEQTENAVDQIMQSFNMTVKDRIRTHPAFKQAILDQICTLALSDDIDDLKVAKIMLDDVIAAKEDK